MNFTGTKPDGYLIELSTDDGGYLECWKYADADWAYCWCLGGCDYRIKHAIYKAIVDTYRPPVYGVDFNALNTNVTRWIDVCKAAIVNDAEKGLLICPSEENMPCGNVSALEYQRFCRLRNKHRHRCV